MALSVLELKDIERPLVLLLRDELLGEKGTARQLLLDGDLLKVLDLPSTKEIFGCFREFYENNNVEDSLRKSVHSWLNMSCSIERQLQVLTVGVAALMAFMQDNWCGPRLQGSLMWLRKDLCDVTSEEDLQSVLVANLVLDGEAVVTVCNHLELLVLARAALLADFPDLQTGLWWRFRCLMIHQQILDEKSPELHDQLIILKEKLVQSEYFKEVRDLSALLKLEISQMHLAYHEVQPSEQLLKSAVEESGLSMNLTGALGKRTRFQQYDLPQLTLEVKSHHQATIELPQEDLPKDLKLNDDVRLDKIAFSNSVDGEYSTLSSVQQACVLGTFAQTQKCQPKDKLADEELLAYLACLLSQPQVWSFQLTCLLFRSKIESNHSRTVERSMTQTQALVDSISASTPGPWQRFHMIFCSYMSPRWSFEEELANLLLSLGCINSALDMYLGLHCWEQVIACYNCLKLRHKAEEIIRQELEKKETVKLWCLLGDATDSLDCYEKAWNLSNQRSARAQRHWGLYYFHRKQYGEAIPHFQESLAHNSLQTTLWFQLGYASLQHEDWTTAATAYRRCCFLEPENFEAWNNLAKAYVKLGQKNRAWKALQEALKWDFENWRVWENFLVVSLDCAVMDEVIQAYHRILDLKEKHVDEEVLEILGRAIIDNIPDCDGVPCGRLLEKSLQLLGRITAKTTNDWKVWRLYSRLTSASPNPTAESEMRAVQHLQKAHRSAVADATWVNDTEMCLEVLGLSEELANVSLTCSSRMSNNKQTLSVLSSAKLSLKSTLSRIKQQRFDLLTGQIEEALLPQYQNLEALYENIVKALTLES